MTRKPMPTSGWCESGHCHKCPEIMRIARVTPSGAQHRELVCSHPCHKETSK